VKIEQIQRTLFYLYGLFVFPKNRNMIMAMKCGNPSTDAHKSNLSFTSISSAYIQATGHSHPLSPELYGVALEYSIASNESILDND